MAGERSDTDVDPRFDPRFQRGFASGHAASGATGPAPSTAELRRLAAPPVQPPIARRDPVPEPELEPLHPLDPPPGEVFDAEFDTAEQRVVPRPSPFEIALWVVTAVLLVGAAATVWSAMTYPSNYFSSSSYTAWDQFVASLDDQAAPMLAIAGLIAGVAALAVGALRVGRR